MRGVSVFSPVEPVDSAAKRLAARPSGRGQAVALTPYGFVRPQDAPFPRACIVLSVTRLLALDLETTGTDPVNDRIVEFAAVHCDESCRPLGAWRQLFNPGTPISAAATAIHGIRDEDVAEAPLFECLAARVQRHLQNSVIIAYNGVRFDIPLLDQELRRAGQPGLRADHPTIDPYLLFLQDAPHSLTGACQYYLHRGHEDAHAAMPDVEAMLDVLRVQAVRRKAGAEALVERPERRWLDLARCIYEDEDGVARFVFGKHKHQPCRTHPSYLQWMLANGFSTQTKDVARIQLRGRIDD